MVGQFVLSDSEVREAIRSRNIVTLKADVTRRNPEAYELMSELGHDAATIPFFVLFPPDNPANPRTHPALFTKEDMLEFLKQ